MKIIQISESEFSVQGHGVHTAYVETVNALRAHTEADVATNSFQSADIRHIHTVGPYSLAQLLLGSGKKVVSAHVIPDSFVGSLIGARYWLWLARLYLRWFYNRAALVIAVSDQTKTELTRLGVKSPIAVLYNMIDTGQYQSSPSQKVSLKKQLDIAADTKVVIGNGQIQPRKRFDSFISIARQMPDTHFIWVGGMPFGRVAADQAAMQKLVDTAPRNVRVTGVVSLEKVAEYFSVGDVFVMTSEQETFGLAIVEAAASGLPVVLRDIPDYDATFRPDAVMCGEAEFVAAIKRLLADDAYYRQAQERAGSIARRYSSEVIVQKLLALYESTSK